MNRNFFLTALLAAVVFQSQAQVNAPDAGGYLDRGRLMYADGNYNGCIDQMLQLRQLHPDASQGEEAVYYVAMSTLSLGDDEALPLLHAFLAGFPASVHRQEVLKAIGDFYFNRAAFGEAIGAYLKVDLNALDDVNAEDVRYRLAYSYLMLAEYDDASHYFYSLITNPTYAGAARFYNAYIAYARRDYNRALELFRNVDTSTEPGNTAPYYLAQIYFLKGDYNRALLEARRMIAANSVPEFTIESRRIAGESLYNLGNTAEAIPYLWEYAAQATEVQPSTFYILGIEEFNNGQYDAAVRLLQQAVKEQNAMSQNAYLYLGQAYLKQGNRASAMMAFENAYRMNYDTDVQETALYNYAVALSEGGRVPFSSSVTVFEDFLNRFPNSRYAPALSEYLIDGYITQDDYEAALSVINKIPSPSDDVLRSKQRVLLVLGTRELSRGNSATALQRFDQARAIASSSPAAADADVTRQATLWSGDCYFAQEKWADAAKAYRQFLDEAPAGDANRAIALYDLGYAYYNQHRYQDALDAFSKACSAPNSDLSKYALADAHNRMGDCYHSLHDFAAADTEYRRAFDLNPSSGDYALYQQALMKGNLGDHPSKIEMLDRLIDRYPSSGLVSSALLAKAESYVAMGNNKQAIATYRELVRQFPNTTDGRNGMLQMAVTYMNMGNRTDAIDTYRKIIYTYPTSEEARLAADDLKHIYAEDGRLNEYVSFINSIPNAPSIDPGELERLSFEVAEEAYLSTSDIDKLQRYLKEYPGGAYTPAVLYYLAEDAEDEGRYDEAYNYAATVILSYPDSEWVEEAYAIKGACELRQGKAEIALATFRELENRTTDPAMLADARMAIMRIARDLGRSGEVVAVTDKLLSSTAAGTPELNEINFTRAYALNRLQRYDDAYALWQQLLTEPSDLYGAKSAYYLGQSQYDRGLIKQAQSTVTDFLSSDSSQDYWRARSVILLSDILRRQGNTFEADEYLRALRNNYRGGDVDIFQLIDQRLK